MAEPAPVRWGVLGAASIATRAVVPAMQASPLTPVVAIASRSLEKARAAATALGITRAYGSYEELLADPGVDAVYNPLPNHLHVPWSIRAALAGKHVLCEKPIALSAAEARELLAVRDRTCVRIGEAFMVRTHPQWEAVRSLLAVGRIGALRLVVGHFSYGPRRPEDIRTRVDWGGGALLDIGCYPITMARWLFGAEPREVMAEVDRDPATGIDRLVSGVLRFPAGQASFTCGGDLVLHQRMQLVGATGRIDVPLPFNPPAGHRCRLLVDDGKDLTGAGAETIEVPAADQYRLQGVRFSRAIRGEGQIPVTLEDAIGNMAVIDAVFRSGVTRGWEVPR